MSTQDNLFNFQRRLKTDIKSIIDNYSDLYNMVKNDPPTKLDLLSLEVTVRAASINRASESILKLIWEIKQYQTINDFPWINQAISSKSEANLKKAQDIDNGLTMLRDEITNELYELEEEYYHSFYKDESKA